MGIYKETIRKYMVGHQMRQVVSNNGVLDLDQFYLDATAVGATQDKVLFEAELNALPTLAKNEAETILVPGIYKNGKIYGFNGATKGLVEFDFSRDSSATYIDKNGIMQVAQPGIPRIDYDPVTKVCKGYLFENVSANLIPYSENFSEWLGGSAVVQTSNKDSKGKNLWSVSRPANAADSVNLSANTGVSVANTTYVATVTVRAGSSDKVEVRIGFAADPESGSASNSGSAELTGARIVSGPGTIRASVTGIFEVTGLSTTQDTIIESRRTYVGAGVPVSFAIYPNGRNVSTSAQGIHVSTAQLEHRVATSYIPTNGSAGIRGADTAVSVSDIIPYSEAGVFVDSYPDAMGSTAVFVRKNSGLLIVLSTTSVGTLRTRAFDSPYNDDSNQSVDGTRKKLLTSYGFGVFKATTNSTYVMSKNYNLQPIVASPLSISSYIHVKSLATFSRQLTDQEHLEITS